MEKINFCEGVVAQMMESEAWQELSCSINWNETQLEKYADKLDWEKVSRNDNMLWTFSMLEKFKNRINWRALSESIKPSLSLLPYWKSTQTSWIGALFQKAAN